MDRIRELRKERGLSQVKLAVMADMDPATLNRLEQGKGNPNLKTLERVADALGVEVADLLGKARRRSSLEPSFNDVLAEERPERDPRASELRRENYLMALAVFASRQIRRWEKELDERLGTRTPEFFGWAQEVMETAHRFHETLFDGEVFSHSLGTLSAAEEDYRSILARELGKSLKITKQILAEWDRRVEEMENGVAEERREINEQIREWTRKISA